MDDMEANYPVKIIYVDKTIRTWCLNHACLIMQVLHGQSITFSRQVKGGPCASPLLWQVF